ncbi:MAG: DNA repair protein RecO [Muricoprocola sp.]
MSDRIQLTGMVISSVPVGEYDKRIVLLTKERGKISGFAKGAKRQNSPLLAATNPFSFGVFECYEGRSSYNIYQAQISHYFEKLSLDFERAYYGMYFLEFADYYTRENADEREMLKLLFVTMRALEHGKVEPKLIRYIYEIRAMMINGEYPDMSDCTLPLQESTIFTIQYILSSPLEKLYSFTLSETVFLELSALQDKFRKKMIDKKFKTLEILESLHI